MRYIFILTILLWSVTTTAYAQNAVYKEIALTEKAVLDEERDILPEGADDTGRKTRGVICQPVYAFLSNNTITVTFQKSIPIATISIYDEATGSIIYTEILHNSVDVNIRLNDVDSASYVIEIIYEVAFLRGNFSL